MPKGHVVPLNDNDLVSIGGNHTLSEANENNNIFLYCIKAPLKWGRENTPEDENNKTASNEGTYKKYL